MSEFGEEFTKDWPLHEFDENLSEFGKELLQKCLSIEKPKNKLINIQDFMQKSEEFPIKFPIDTCRVKTQPTERHNVIEQQIASAYPLLHERVLFLILSFLEHKLKYGKFVTAELTGVFVGTLREKQLYGNMTLSEFVQRLLTKRCVSFVGFFDRFILLSGETGHGEDYLKIGTEEEVEPLTLDNVLSYDEVKIAALLSISCHTEFINDGQRNNCGKVESDLSKIEKQGVVIGLIGARFVKPHKMEYEDIMITKQQNIIENGYGCKDSNAAATSNVLKMWQYLFSPKNYAHKKAELQDYRRLWNKFYEEEDHLYHQASTNNKRFNECFKPMNIFDNLIMKKRFAISFDTLLVEANERAFKQQKLAYIHVVGIGLGTWLAAPEQEKIFLASFQQRLKYLLPKLNNIGVIHFSWFRLNEWEDLKHEAIYKSETHKEGGIKILLSKRNPNEKLLPPYENMLPVVSFAWDGNALPGNEFWMGSLHTSNDPSAACSTLITELFNPHINTEYVNSNNLHIVSTDLGIIHIKNYAENVLKKIDNSAEIS